jgi:hypothetical protein
MTYIWELILTLSIVLCVGRIFGQQTTRMKVVRKVVKVVTNVLWLVWRTVSPTVLQDKDALELGAGVC